MSQFLKNEEADENNSLNSASLIENRDSFIGDQINIMNIQTMNSENFKKFKESLSINYWLLKP